jgi:translation elongation factor EF-1alpha
VLDRLGGQSAGRDTTVYPGFYELAVPPSDDGAAQQQQQQPSLTFTLIDAPGHRDFVISNLSRTLVGDVAVIVVSAALGDYEAGVARDGGATREHALMAYCMGMKRAIVAVNKMDHSSVAYSEQRFKEIQADVGVHLRKIGYTDQNVFYVPISAAESVNVVFSEATAALMPWYGQGPTLLQLMRNAVEDQRAGELGDVKSKMCVPRDFKPGDPLRMLIVSSMPLQHIKKLTRADKKKLAANAAADKQSSAAASAAAASSAPSQPLTPPPPPPPPPPQRYLLTAKILCGVLRKGNSFVVLSTKTDSPLGFLAERIMTLSWRDEMALAVSGALIHIEVAATERSFLNLTASSNGPSVSLQAAFARRIAAHGSFYKNRVRPAVLAKHQSAPRNGPLLVRPLRGVAGHFHDAPLPVLSFVAQIIVLQHPNIICDGYEAICSIGATYCAARWRLLTKMDRRTGRTTVVFSDDARTIYANEAGTIPEGCTVALPDKANRSRRSHQRSVKSGDALMAELTPLDPAFMVAKFNVNDTPSRKTLGRLMFFDLRNKLMGVGVVKSVVQDTRSTNCCFKWHRRKVCLLIRFCSGNRFRDAFRVWNIMVNTALFL